MLSINPDECIDCGVCEPECPAEAIIPDTKSGSEMWVEINRTYALLWPNITRKGMPPQDADQWLSTENKYKDHFSPNPGKGD